MEYKGYKIARQANMMGYEISHVGRGSLHNSLKGVFTSVEIAKMFIDSYKPNEVEDGADATSGGEQVRSGSSNRRKPANES